MRVEIIEATEHYKLEAEVNKYLGRHYDTYVQDIKYSTFCHTDGRTSYSAMIIIKN